jgi:hypothetical protein
MREPAKTFKDLIVWRREHQFVLSMYKITNELHKQLFEVSKLLEAYRSSILDSVS